MKRLVVLVLVALVAVAGSAIAQDRALGQGRSASALVVPGPDAATFELERALLHADLVGAEPAGAAAKPLVVAFTAADRAAVAAPSGERRYRVGLDKAVQVALDPAAGRVPFGAVGKLGGATVWSGVVRVAGATALRLHFAPFALPDGAALYVYGSDGQAFGPYEGWGPLDSRELWTNTVFGEEVHLQVRYGATDARGGGLASALVLAEVGVMTDRFAVGKTGAVGGDAFCSALNAPCVECAGNVPAAIAPAKQAVAEMLFSSGGGQYICTGGLIADRPRSAIPYFLTANHCISTASEASSLETYFDFVTSCSAPDCQYAWTVFAAPTTLGATIVKASATSDYTLMRLASAPATPDGQVYLGWSSTAVANTNGFGLYRISHPSGAPQAYSTHSVSTSAGTCRSWPRGNWIYSKDTFGATEGGSSGSPVLNSSGQIVGQLSGACGTNVNDNCDRVSNATVDGAFAAYYSAVAPFLDPAGGPSCKPIGTTCAANSECCSLSCKGKPGAKVCK